MTFLVAVITGVIMVGICVTTAQSQNSTGKAGGATRDNNQSQVAKGRYIVEGVARCGQCHTPRDPQGGFDRSRWLEGAPVWLLPAEPTEDWPLQAPRIAGSPPGTDAEMIKLLMTGLWRNNKPLRPPMPQFRMTVEDAQAVVAYLKSLNPQQ